MKNKIFLLATILFNSSVVTYAQNIRDHNSLSSVSNVKKLMEGTINSDDSSFFGDIFGVFNCNGIMGSDIAFSILLLVLFVLVFLYIRCRKRLAFAYISEQKKVANMYNENQVILGELPVGVAIYDKDGRMEYVNDALVQIFGVSNKEFYIENYVNLFKNHRFSSEDILNLKEGSEGFNKFMEYDFQAASDVYLIDALYRHKIYIDEKVRCIKDNNGEIDKYLLISNDITEEHLHKIEKDYSRKRIAYAIDNAEIALMEYDVIEQTIFAHRNSISGLTLERPLSIDAFFKYIDAEESSEIEFRKMLSEMNDGVDKTFSIDIRIKTKTATGFEWMYCNISSDAFERDKNGRIIKYSGRMKNNTEWILLNNTLAELNTQLQRILDVGNMLPFECKIKDNKFSVTTPNKKEPLFFDIVDRVFEFEHFLSLVNREYRDEIKVSFNKMLSGNLTEVRQEISFDVEHLRDKVFEIDMTVVHNEEFGVSLRSIGYIQDITERQQLISDLKKAKEDAEKSAKLKSAFLADMSHEIRTPLNSIIGFSELLVDTDDAKTKAEYLSIIAANNELLLKLINDILDLSKIESNSAEINISELDFAQFFNEMYLSMKQWVINPDVTLSIINPYSRCIVNADKNLLAQVCTNYITNAIKYTVKGTIDMGYESINNGIRIYIKDTGIGIADCKHHSVFQRFAKLDNFAHGTGLGMPITKALTEAMGGEVGFESKEGVGSTFWAWIPYGSQRIEAK